jgi:hypothetical protein
MHVAPRSYLTAGIAVLGAGAIALAPVQPIPAQVALDPHRVVSNLGVGLAAAVDPITAWVNTFETAAANIGILGEFYMQKPFPLLQTIGANIATYIEELGNGNAGLIPEQIWGNIQTFFQAPWSPGTPFPLAAPPAIPDPVVLPLGEYLSDAVREGFNSPLALNQSLLVFEFLPEAETNPACYDDGNCVFATAAPILNFLNTNFSGQLLGLLGPVLSPFVSLVNSFTAIGEYFEAGDVQSALFELINIPANMTNAFLNGAGYLDLTEIVANFLDLPVKNIGLYLGGLLTATPVDGSVDDPDNPPTGYSGGVAFDAVAAGVETPLGVVNFGGIPVGWFGSVIGLGQFLADQLLITPPAPPPMSAAQPAAATPPTAVELPAPAPAETEVESAPVVVDEAPEAAPEIEAEIEAAVAEVEVEVADAPAAADDPGPATATGSDDSADKGSRASDSRRGSANAD